MASVLGSVSSESDVGLGSSSTERLIVDTPSRKRRKHAAKRARMIASTSSSCSSAVSAVSDNGPSPTFDSPGGALLQDPAGGELRIFSPPTSLGTARAVGTAQEEHRITSPPLNALSSTASPSGKQANAADEVSPQRLLPLQREPSPVSTPSPSAIPPPLFVDESSVLADGEDMEDTQTKTPFTLVRKKVKNTSNHSYRRAGGPGRGPAAEVWCSYPVRVHDLPGLHVFEIMVLVNPTSATRPVSRPHSSRCGRLVEIAG